MTRQRHIIAREHIVDFAKHVFTTYDNIYRDIILVATPTVEAVEHLLNEALERDYYEVYFGDDRPIAIRDHDGTVVPFLSSPVDFPPLRGTVASITTPLSDAVVDYTLSSGEYEGQRFLVTLKNQFGHHVLTLKVLS